MREVTGDERTVWYDRGIAVYPDYADYEVSAAEHDRVIPVFVTTPTS